MGFLEWILCVVSCPLQYGHENHWPHSPCDAGRHARTPMDWRQTSSLATWGREPTFCKRCRLKEASYMLFICFNFAIIWFEKGSQRHGAPKILADMRGYDLEIPSDMSHCRTPLIGILGGIRIFAYWSGILGSVKGGVLQNHLPVMFSWIQMLFCS